MQGRGDEAVFHKVERVGEWAGERSSGREKEPQEECRKDMTGGNIPVMANWSHLSLLTAPPD